MSQIYVVMAYRSLVPDVVAECNLVPAEAVRRAEGAAM